MTSNPDDPNTCYTLEEVVVLSQSAERKVLFYCRKGLLRPSREAEGSPHFDDEGLARVRRIELLRQQHGMNWAAIQMIMTLHAEVETLRRELRFLR